MTSWRGRDLITHHSIRQEAVSQVTAPSFSAFFHCFGMSLGAERAPVTGRAEELICLGLLDRFAMLRESVSKVKSRATTTG